MLIEEGKHEDSGCFVVTVLFEYIALVAASLFQAKLKTPVVLEALVKTG